MREGSSVADLTSLVPRSTSTLAEWREADSEFCILWLLAKAARIYARAAERARRDLDFRGLLIERFEESRRELAETDPKAAKLWGRGEDLVDGLDASREELDAVLYAKPEEREEAWSFFLADGEGCHYAAAEILYPALAPGDSPLAALTNASAWAEALAWARSMDPLT